MTCISQHPLRYLLRRSPFLLKQTKRTNYDIPMKKTADSERFSLGYNEAQPHDWDPDLVDKDPVKAVETLSAVNAFGTMSYGAPLPSEGFMLYERVNGGAYQIGGMIFGGSFIVFPRHVFHWNVSSPSEITPASIAIATHTYPQIEGIIFGLGENGHDGPVSDEIQNYLQGRGIGYTCCSTHYGLFIWNMMMEERRNVAGFFIGKRPYAVATQGDTVHPRVRRAVSSPWGNLNPYTAGSDISRNPSMRGTASSSSDAELNMFRPDQERLAYRGQMWKYHEFMVTKAESQGGSGLNNFEKTLPDNPLDTADTKNWSNYGKSFNPSG
eukprot:TRINITY_DN5174_c0_g1_i1.p1 TRINITY_DN5174_c0_g1~~TRINITY_DN5174_c0_g1_i1.p1  ORF type:complete len:325 (+),score=27.51 TRINITY_DN5174_c0_g1_i1:165-1139(+)